jgi:hypothetical protein
MALLGSPAMFAFPPVLGLSGHARKLFGKFARPE